jgi:uncharacterized protein YndB with AHSA1/START domain
MYQVSSAVRVLAVEPGRRIRFSWDGYDPAHPHDITLRVVLHAHPPSVREP